MCRLLHVEWRCKHKQNIWEYCRDAAAPSRTPSVTERSKQPCDAFVSKHTLTPAGPTEDEYRNFCCKFVCCLEDQADSHKKVQDLQAALGMTEKDSIPHVPSLFLSRQQKALKEARKKFQLLLKRHEERCEALCYGLGVVQEGDTWRAPAETPKSLKRRSKDSKRISVEGSIVEVHEAASEVVDDADQRPVEQKVVVEDAATDGKHAQEAGEPSSIIKRE
jgi:hypothetical protein